MPLEIEKTGLKFLDFPFEIKDMDEKEGIIEGYASTFGNKDEVGDIVMPGAFKRTLKENKGIMPILADHNPYMQIGMNIEASEDDKGLKVKGKLDIGNNQKAKEKFSMAKLTKEVGGKSGLSIGYRIISAKPSENEKAYLLEELKLFEYSMVTFPANRKASVSRIKHLFLDQNELSDEQLVECVGHLLGIGYTIDRIEKAIREFDDITVPEDPDHWLQSLGERMSKLRSEIFGE